VSECVCVSVVCMYVCEFVWCVCVCVCVCVVCVCVCVMEREKGVINTSTEYIASFQVCVLEYCFVEVNTHITCTYKCFFFNFLGTVKDNLKL